jgi:hypothetical protein
MSAANQLPVALFDAEIERRFPDIAWRDPIHISVANGWGCRLCIARNGFKAQDAKRLLFPTLLDFQIHQRNLHA